MTSARWRYRGAAAALLAIWLPGLAPAAEAPAPSDLDGVVVTFGRAERRIGQAVAASEGALAGADLSVRPILRTGEILESVPGMIVTQHSGSGKANQYFLRGFNLDHGADFGVEIDGVPMNFRTHGHGQGYLDINGLIPELVDRVDYRKGPYRADAGDFNLVGGARMRTRDRFDAPFVQVEAGRFDHRRAVAAGSFAMGGGEMLLAGQLKTYDGPWALAERLRHVSLYGKHTAETPMGVLRTSLSIYDATWRPTEQIPERAIGTLVPDAYGALDRDLTGRTERQILSVQLAGPEWRGGVYAQRYDWAMVSNFTFFLEDPLNGDQLEQAEKLWTFGGRLERRFEASEALTLTMGGEARHEDIASVGLYQTVGGRRFRTRSRFAVEETSGALYAEAAWRPAERLSVFAGLRGDAYRFETRALEGGAWNGRVSDGIVSPKLGASYEVADGIALYANWGHGFHSNDARGVTALVDAAPGLVRGRGEEVGVRFERGALVATATAWRMRVDSELIYVGDAGSVEPSAASRRRGVELTAFWRPRPWLAFDGVYALSRARFVDAPGADRIPGALERAAELGGSAIFPNWNAGLRIRHLGPSALTEDNAERSASTTVVNLRAAWTPGRYEVFAELLNALNSGGKDIAYVYESFLPQIDAGPVTDRHSRAVEPRMVRAGVKVSF